MSCELCTERHAGEIWRGRHFYVFDAGEPLFPCYLRVAAVRHVPEMSSLAAEERRELLGILEAIEEEMIAVMHPDKVNWAQFGNMVPHLHWHIIARWKDDSHFPESPWGRVQREVPAATTAARAALTEKLRARLRERLEREFS